MLYLLNLLKFIFVSVFVIKSLIVIDILNSSQNDFISSLVYDFLYLFVFVSLLTIDFEILSFSFFSILFLKKDKTPS